MRRAAVMAILLGLALPGAAEAAMGGSSGMAALLEPSIEVPASPGLSSDPADDLRSFMERSQGRSQITDQADYAWSTNRIILGAAGGRAVNSLRVSVGKGLRTPGGAPLSLDRATYEPDTYEISVIRDWPRMVRFDAGAYDVDFSPHAGVGWTNRGGALAEAGATLRLTQRLDDEVRDRLGDLGVRDGADFGDQGRWYMFAAASGRAVGLNMTREEGRWDDASWSTDPASRLVGDAHLGVGWRKGPLQTSLGYIHREMKGQNMIWGQETKDDSLVAFSFSIKPER